MGAEHQLLAVDRTDAASARAAQPRVVAHRGARWLAVENTVEALRIAFEEGADGVEFDVQLTADGELVVFHDDQLRSLTGAEGRVSDLSWRALRALVLQDSSGRRGRIPHLDEVIELLLSRQGLINLELKVVGENGHALAEAAAAALLAAGCATWLVSSFDGSALRRLANCGISTPRGLLIDDDVRCDWWQAGQASAAGVVALSAAATAVGGHLVAVHPHANLLSAERLTLWRAAGLAVNVWTLNAPAQWARAGELGVAGIITDDPGGCARWLARPVG